MLQYEILIKPKIRVEFFLLLAAKQLYKKLYIFWQVKTSPKDNLCKMTLANFLLVFFRRAFSLQYCVLTISTF